MAKRLAREANPKIRVDCLFADVREPAVARRLVNADFLFLAANSDSVRLLVNAISQQYLIPAVQLGAKVRTNPADGSVLAVDAVARPVLPGHGCLWSKSAALEH